LCSEEDVFYRPEFGVQCPAQIAGCDPCPQTYDCLDSTWHSLVDYLSVYGRYYNESWQQSNVTGKLTSKVMAALDTTQHPKSKSQDRHTAQTA